MVQSKHVVGKFLHLIQRGKFISINFRLNEIYLFLLFFFRQTIVEGSVQNIHSPLIKSLLPKHQSNNSYVNDTTNYNNNKTLMNHKLTTEINLLDTISYNATDLSEFTEKVVLNVTSMPLCPEIPPNLRK